MSVANVAREVEDHVELPLGLTALYWIRMYKPLVEQGLPQLPGSAMGFVKEPFRALAGMAPFDLRPGGVFSEALRRAVGAGGCGPVDRDHAGDASDICG